MSTATTNLLRRLLRDAPNPLPGGEDVGACWRALCAAEPRAAIPFDRAVIAGFRSDRLAGAFAGGYQAALRMLVPGTRLDECILSLCVTEHAGNSPRAIEAALTPRADGGFALSGRKRWSTMAPLASVLLVAASEGADAGGRKRFKLVRVESDRPGVTIHRMPPTQFVPEVPHAELELVDVELGDDAPLPGDGYTQYVKRFRTIEDIHIHGAILGYVLSVARRFGFPQAVIERLASAITTTRVLAAMDPDAPETHLALAGTLARDTTLLDHSEAHWQHVEPEEAARWKRDRQMFGSVAGQIREARRVRAWQRIAGGGIA